VFTQSQLQAIADALGATSASLQITDTTVDQPLVPLLAIIGFKSYPDNRIFIGTIPERAAFQPRKNFSDR
jgi:hypothetical protein